MQKILLLNSMILIWSCSYIPPSTSDNFPETSFTEEDARIIFEAEVISPETRSLTHDDIYYQERFMWNIGEITPDWSTAVYSKYGNLENIDVQIRSTNRFRVIQKDHNTDKKRTIKCYHKLVIIRNTDTGKYGNFIVFFIATNKYSKTHKGFINEWFTNGGGMGNFSGIKIYTRLDGRIIRVNQYISGKKVAGIYVGKEIPKHEYLKRLNSILKLMKNIVVQKGRYRGGPITKAGEDDDYWDFGDEDDDYWDCGNGLFIDADGDILYDSDADGEPDSILIDESVCTPDDDSGWNDDNNDDSFWDADESTYEDDFEMDEDIDPDPDYDRVHQNNEEDDNNDDKLLSVQRLKEIANEAVNTIIQKYGSKKAYCNQGVREAFSLAYKTDLPNVNANSLIQYWKDTPISWQQCNMAQAITWANQGYFVVAGWINTEGSGHVVLLVSGTGMGNWNGEYQKVPLVMDTGYEKRFTNKVITQSFGKSKHSNVVFYRYR